MPGPGESVGDEACGTSRWAFPAPSSLISHNGGVLILLPPSETKTRPERTDARLNLDALAFAPLAAPRQTMLRAVLRTAAGKDAADKLGVPASAPELVERMAALPEEPVGAPLAVYSGVLFDQLDPAVTIPEDRRVLIQSALLGVVDADTDRIPAYRLSAGSTVTRLGKAATWWARHLRPLGARLLEDTADGTSPVVIDCRSGAYRSMMPMHSGTPGASAARGASEPAVRVLEVAPVQERGGVRTVVSHDAKRFRGWVTRVLLDAPAPAATPDEVVDQLRAGFGGTLGVELEEDRLVIVDRVG